MFLEINAEQTGGVVGHYPFEIRGDGLLARVIVDTPPKLPKRELSVIRKTIALAIKCRRIECKHNDRNDWIRARVNE